MSDVHARLSASGAKKWMNCPGAVQMEERFEDKPSEFAKEGTKAHALGELKIRLAANQMTRREYGEGIAELGDISGELDEYTDGYRDFVIERYSEVQRSTSDAQLLIEQRLDFSAYVPGGFGTGDVVIVGDGIIEIIDLKYGSGVRVSAENNPQLRLYALGAVEEFGFLYDAERVRMTIYQPRMDNISSEEITIDELIEWGGIVSARARLAADDSITDCVAGDHCDSGFCKARAVCRAYADKRLAIARYDFRIPSALSNEEISEILEQSDRLSKWAGLVSDYALDRAVNHGAVFPGYKLVEGRSNRKYCKPESEIADILTEHGYKPEDLFNTSLKGITEMEKLLGKTNFKKLLKDCVIKPAGRPALVPLDDKRSAISSEQNAADDFKNIIDKKGEM